MRLATVPVLLLICFALSMLGQAQTTTNFTYQGYLEDGGVPANGTYDFYFQLFDLLTLGTQQGTNRYAPDTAVTNGQFTVLLDWGYSVFPGAPRFLQIYVRPGASTGSYTKLTPRQQLTPVPYALAALNAWRLNGNGFTTPGANFLGTTDNQALEFKVNSSRVLRLEPNDTSPNILGGYPGNSITPGAYGSIIAGGGYSAYVNTIYDHYCTISGGVGNRAGDNSDGLWWEYATVGGGCANHAKGTGSTIAGGTFNQAYGTCGTVPGGTYSYANGDYSFAAGRYAKALHTGAFVWADSTMADFSSDADNQFKVRASGGVNFTVGANSLRLQPGNGVLLGGGTNSLTAGVTDSAIGGGFDNRITDIQCNIGGGVGNRAGNDAGTLNDAFLNCIGGGGFNTAAGVATTIGGGYTNLATNVYATVGGGAFNNATGYASTIAGGRLNNAGGDYAAVGGGYQNTAGGTNAFVAGGDNNIASGTNSFAGGHKAKASLTGSFVWLDSSSDSVWSPGVNNQIIMRGTGGFYFITGESPAVYAMLSPGSGSWGSSSDRNSKTEITTLEPRAVLNKLLAVPISRWRYKTETGGVYHFGPMAQDFYAAFQLGPNDTSITTVDADGVTFAAIQGLYQVVQDKDAQIAALQSRVTTLEHKAAETDALKTRLAALEALVQKLAGQKPAGGLK